MPTLAVSDFKGVSYARKFPDSERVLERASPFGYLEIYSSSYLHFAPGLSDNAAFNLPKMPANAYLGMYIDGEGPSGIIRDLPPEQTAYYRYLPMVYPYLIKPAPDTFVVQFGGGISTSVALRNSRRVTVAEGNPAVLDAFRTDQGLREFIGDVLNNPKVRVIDYEGRLFLACTSERYDVIDLSLADSAGLSSPGGFAVIEKFSYSREAMTSYMRALKDGGVLSVTPWNKEEPPKSVLKLYATMAAAARKAEEGDIANRFFVVSSYLSTATVLYKRGGFSTDEIGRLLAHTRAMSFDAIYYPGFKYDQSQSPKVLDNYRNQIFSNAASEADSKEELARENADGPVPATLMGQLAWHHLIHGGWDEISERYVFDTRPLTNSRPYFAGYVKPGDLPRAIGRLELLQDEWGYLLLWATLAIACIASLSLILIPVIFGWRTIFCHSPGKFRTIIYFACLGAGYIMVEVGLISDFMLALSNATVSASVLITSMLVFSGLGALCSERYLDRARHVMPKIFVAIGGMLIGYGLFLDRALDLIGTLPYPIRLVCCFALIFPPAFLMGFPMPTAMTTLARLGKDHMFLWAWGINGCFSVIGAAMVPIIATSFGLTAVLMIAGSAYVLAIPAFFAVLLPLRGKRRRDWPQPRRHEERARGFCTGVPSDGCALGLGPAQVLVEPRHDLNEIAGAIPVVELMHQDLVPGVLAGAGGAGQAEDVGCSGDPGNRPRLNRRCADLCNAHHHEQGREALHALLQQGLDRFRRHVATGEAGAAGGDDHIDRRIGDPLFHMGTNRVDIVGNDGAAGDRVPCLLNALHQGCA
jgi:hypothetical protein